MFGHAHEAAGNLLADGLGDVMTWDAQSRLSMAGGASYMYDPLGLLFFDKVALGSPYGL
jgi:hypothetical protein